jgi:DNA-binding transcriptional regulator YdaS (Cro superfamily)
MNTAKLALQKAIERAGGQTALAGKLGVTQSRVHYWLNDAKKGVSPDMVPAIEEITGVPRHELRPDVYSRPVEKRRRLDRDDALGHFSRYRHVRRDRFKSAEDVARHIRALREEWTER